MANSTVPDLSKIPVAPPPPGQVPNFINPDDSLVRVGTTVGITMTAIAVVAIAARLVGQWKQSRRWFLDDLLCVLAFACFTAFDVLEYVVRKTAHHSWDVALGMYNIPIYSQVIFTNGLLYAPGMACAKCAILIMYLRLFQVSRTLKLFIWVGIGFVCLTYGVDIPLFIYFCSPRAHEAWDLQLLGKCQPYGLVALIQGVISVLIDMYIFVLPLPLLSRLQLPLHKKLGVMLVFATGMLGIAASALSLAYRVRNWQRIDPTWNGAQVDICIYLEGIMSVIVSCCPALAAFCRHTISQSRVFSSLKSFLTTQRGRSSHGRDQIEREKKNRIATMAPVSRFTNVFDSSHSRQKGPVETTSTTSFF